MINLIKKLQTIWESIRTHRAQNLFLDGHSLFEIRAELTKKIGDIKMSKKIKRIIAKTEIDKEGRKLTAKCLKRLEGENLSYPVTAEFDKKQIVGYINKLKYNNGKLIAYINLDKKIDIVNKIFRWAGYVNKERLRKDKVRSIQSFELDSVGLTKKKYDNYK